MGLYFDKGVAGGTRWCVNGTKMTLRPGCTMGPAARRAGPEERGYGFPGGVWACCVDNKESSPTEAKRAHRA